MGQNLPTYPKISAARPALRRPLPEPVEPEQTHQQDVKILGVDFHKQTPLGFRVLNNPQLLKNTAGFILTLIKDGLLESHPKKV